MKRLQVGSGFNDSNPFPGDTWNELIDQAERSIRNGQAPPPLPPGTTAIPTTVRVKNSLSEHLPIYSILGIGDPLNTPSVATPNDNETLRPLLNGVTPTTAQHSSKFLVIQGPAAQGSGAEGVRNGFTWVKIQVVNSGHTFAGVKDTDTTQLLSDTSGPAEIWWKESGTGTKWAFVFIGAVGTTAVDPPLRRFELTANKATTDATATVKFLDDAGNMVGSDVTVYDPMGKFYGKNAAFFGSGTGFRGVALLRRDPAAVEADRWEIVDMEGWASWVVMQYAGSPDNEWQMQSFGGDQWNFRQPVEVGDPVTIADPLGMLGEADGDMFIGVMVNPDTSPPTYQEREIKRAGYSAVTIKVPTAISVELIDGDTKLEVKLDYETYDVMGKYIEDGDGSLADTEDATECE